MIHAAKTISTLFLLLGSAQAFGGDSLHWREFDASMSDEEYRDACRDNQRYIRKFLTTYSKATMTSMGVPKAGVNFMGAAAGLAAGQDAKFYLNDSKLFAVELKDATEEDRAIFLGVKVDW